MRINRYIAAATGLSRRAADAAIAASRVTVDDQPATAGHQILTGMQVRLDGQPVSPSLSHKYIMLNKPVGYVSSRTRQGSDPTLYDLLPAEYHKLRTVGRLDRDSSGLMLLSDDGDFIYRHTHPSQGHVKTYEIILSRPFAPTSRERLEIGVKLADGPSRVKVIKYDGPRVEVSLGEGRNRQLRRTFGALGYGVEQLQRLTMGNYSLGELKSGEWRKVAGDEVEPA